ncbi:MAG: response regulator [Verrucomicrobia bacterium]|nr:response regulator [Verrucomicrobiota bacterium]
MLNQPSRESAEGPDAFRKGASIFTKLTLAFLLVSLAALGISAWQSYLVSRDALKTMAFDKLTALRATKKRQIENCFRTLRDEVLTVAESQQTRTALRDLANAVRNTPLTAAQIAADEALLRGYYENEYLPRVATNSPAAADIDALWPTDPVTRHWQARYLAANPFPVGSKDNFIQPGTPTSVSLTPYDIAHAASHPTYRSFIKRFGFYDLFLVDARDGRVVYTVFKETDYGTSLLTGPHKDSNIADLFRRILASDDPRLCALTDYQSYAPSYLAPAAFIGAPVYDGPQKIGVLIAQVPVNEINTVMTGDRQWAAEGQGQTGETYLVGPDQLMRTDSRFLIENSRAFLESLRPLGIAPETLHHISNFNTTILALPVPTEAARDALAGNSGTRIILDYRAMPVLSSWTPLAIPDVQWVLLSEIDAAEAFAPVETLRQRTLYLSLALLAPILLLAWLVARTISRPASALLRGIRQLQHGHTDIALPIHSHDEIGELAHAFNQMAARLHSTTVSKDYVDSVLNSMCDTLLVIAPGPADPAAEWLVTDLNPHAVKTFSQTRQALLRRPLSQLLIPNTPLANAEAPHVWTTENLLRVLQPAESTAAIPTLEGTLLTAERPTVTLSLAPIHRTANPSRQPDRIVILAHDITDQKAAQNALARANELKDSFLANTSHELRTPLNGIIGVAESLIEGAAGKITPALEDNLGMIVTSARRLAHLVNDILDFSKLRHRTIDLQRRPVDLRAITDIVINLTRPVTHNKPIDIFNRIPHELPLVHADENRLQQILYNLIGNGIKFTDEGRVDITATQQGELIAVRVTDTGIGIPADKFESIFESFQQGDATTARLYSGTGLGLAITRQLVELHGGTITVESEPGRGSVFTFTLPLSQESRPEPVAAPTSQVAGLLARTLSPARQDDPEEDEAVTAPSAARSLEGTRVLIVDDEPVNLQVLNNTLTLQGCSITQAASGHEALDHIRSAPYPFDIILLDVMMPRMTGYECCQRIRETASASDLPVLMLTARNQVSDLLAGFEAGANDYLTKPFSRHELIVRIRNHVRLKTMHHAAGRFVPHEFLRFLQKQSLDEIRPGDQVQKHMTLLFADVRGFTALSEAMTLQESFDFVNEYIRQMEPCIRAQHGFVDKFIGDAIMALFHTGPDSAVHAALAMLRRIETWNVERQHSAAAPARLPIRIGIGIHTGSLLLGTIGGENRLESTVISDSVNLAARVESLTKHYGVSLLLTQETFTALREPWKFKTRVIDTVRAQGKTQPTTLYEVFDTDPPAVIALKEQTLPEFDRATRLYRQGHYAEALRHFEGVLALNPADLPAQTLTNRCREQAQLPAGAKPSTLPESQ